MRELLMIRFGGNKMGYFTGKTLMITGGTGSFGNAVLERFLDTDIKEIVSQVKKILLSEQMRYFVKSIYGVNLELTVATANEISTNLTNDPRGTSQLVGIGMGSSITGKHFDRIFTDDIVNVADRASKAERDKTKIAYQELQNIKNRNGRIFNTGTPWHKDDAFVLMPNPERWDCYSTGLMSEEEIANLKLRMTSALFAANYELRHIAAEDVIFENPKKGFDPALAEQGVCHIDAAYGGEDFTAFTICNKKDGNYYIFGKLWRKHVDDCEDEIIKLRKAFNAGKIYCEDNGDKGYLAKDLRKRGERAVTYHESMNKFVKITSYLKNAWIDVIFVTGTDEEYINQICDYNENAEHDDAPDSAASAVRRVWSKKESTYIPIW
jgi:predicted phage terminase large subunit-like protein